jgi:hypothetical protein
MDALMIYSRAGAGALADSLAEAHVRTRLFATARIKHATAGELEVMFNKLELEFFIYCASRNM